MKHTGNEAYCYCCSYWLPWRKYQVVATYPPCSQGNDVNSRHLFLSTEPTSQRARSYNFTSVIQNTKIQNNLIQIIPLILNKSILQAYQSEGSMCSIANIKRNCS
ncbi:TPA: hypothetical protein HL387_22220 [Escherichia coli]|nr:hypothetical protein [Escherichia coli]